MLRESLFFVSKRKFPKNEVLVAAEPGKYLQNESQKSYVGQNWSQTDFAVQCCVSQLNTQTKTISSRPQGPQRFVPVRVLSSEFLVQEEWL